MRSLLYIAPRLPLRVLPAIDLNHHRSPLSPPSLLSACILQFVAEVSRVPVARTDDSDSLPTIPSTTMTSLVADSEVPRIHYMSDTRLEDTEITGLLVVHDGVVLTLSNGLGHLQSAVERWGADRVLMATTTSGASIDDDFDPDDDSEDLDDGVATDEVELDDEDFDDDDFEDEDFAGDFDPALAPPPGYRAPD